MNINETNSIINAVREAFCMIQGTASVAVLFSDINSLLLATNNGSLYTFKDEASPCKIFASEKYILQQLAKKRNLRKTLRDSKISQISPGIGELIDLNTLNTIKFSLKTKKISKNPIRIKKKARTIVDHSPQDNLPFISTKRQQDDKTLLYEEKAVLII